MPSPEKNEIDTDEEMVELDERTVNPSNVKLSPSDFELIKLLGTGGYGKASIFEAVEFLTSNFRSFWPEKSAVQIPTNCLLSKY